MKRILLVLLLLLTGAPAFAGPKSKTNDLSSQLRKGPIATAIENKIAGPSASRDPIESLLGTLDAKLLPDLQYALKLAQASGSKVTAPCYEAWINIIQTRQTAVKDDAGNSIEPPEPGVITKFEKLVELRNSLQPDSDFMVKCSPVASMVKKDIAGFIGVVLTGGAGLATLVPGL